MEVWLHIGLPDGEPGYHAWSLHHLGFATWAPDEETVVARIPVKFDEYRLWLDTHQLGSPKSGDNEIRVVETVRGDEILFERDRQPASIREIDRTIELLKASRSDLLAILENIPEDTLSWNPPYRRFAPWADWRTIRATLAHLANSETHYYLAMIGYKTIRSPASPNDPWREYLSSTRAETVQVLRRLRDHTDRTRIHAVRRHGRRSPQGAAEEWSVRKMLRRVIRHELLHTKSIHRILTESQQQHP